MKTDREKLEYCQAVMVKVAKSPILMDDTLRLELLMAVKKTMPKPNKEKKSND